MAGPATGWNRPTVVGNLWRKGSTNLIDLDGTGLRLSFHLSGSMSWTGDYGTASAWGSNGWSSGEITSTGTSIIPTGGIALTSSFNGGGANAITVAVTDSTTYTAFTISPINITTGTMANFDTLILYDTGTATPSNSVVAGWNLGSAVSWTSPQTCIVTFGSTPIANTAFYVG